MLGVNLLGTSLVTKNIELLVHKLSENLIAVGSNNLTGFWKGQDILQSNDKLLGSNQTSRHFPSDIG